VERRKQTKKIGELIETLPIDAALPNTTVGTAVFQTSF
jgi:hypothetical protein